MKNYLTLMVLLASASAFAESTNNQKANSSSEVQSPEYIAELVKEAENSPNYNHQMKETEATVSSQASKAAKQSTSADIPSTQSPQYNPQYTVGNISGGIQSVINYGEAKQDNE